MKNSCFKNHAGSSQVFFPYLPPAYRPEYQRHYEEEQEKRETAENSQLHGNPLWREEKTSHKKEQRYQKDRGDCIIPVRPVRQDKGDEIEEPDRFTQRSDSIDGINGKDDHRGYNRYAKIRCKSAEDGCDC